MNKKFYSMHFRQKAYFPANDLKRINFIISHIPDKRLKILDIGCYNGSMSSLMKKNSNTVYGVDISAPAVRMAKKKGIIVKEGDFLEKDYFPGISFDIIVAAEIIEHVFDTDFFIQRISSKLKKNGKLIITTPNVASLPRRFLLLFGKTPFLDWGKRNAIGHIRYFTFENLEILLKDNNFSVLESQSDIINFHPRGLFFSTMIPNVWKTLGKTIMIYAQKRK